VLIVGKFKKIGKAILSGDFPEKISANRGESGKANSGK
jgi:hypothetical protein